jgi:hypothetical protein
LQQWLPEGEGRESGPDEMLGFLREVARLLETVEKVQTENHVSPHLASGLSEVSEK